eukprot:tig00021582_g22638.t1
MRRADTIPLQEYEQEFRMGNRPSHANNPLIREAKPLGRAPAPVDPIPDIEFGMRTMFSLPAAAAFVWPKGARSERIAVTPNNAGPEDLRQSHTKRMAGLAKLAETGERPRTRTELLAMRQARDAIHFPDAKDPAFAFGEMRKDLADMKAVIQCVDFNTQMRAARAAAEREARERNQRSSETQTPARAPVAAPDEEAREHARERRRESVQRYEERERRGEEGGRRGELERQGSRLASALIEKPLYKPATPAASRPASAGPRSRPATAAAASEAARPRAVTPQRRNSAIKPAAPSAAVAAEARRRAGTAEREARAGGEGERRKSVSVQATGSVCSECGHHRHRY